MSKSDGKKESQMPAFVQNSLKYLEFFQNVRNQKYNQKISAVDVLKIEGNLNFKSGNFKNATQNYESVKISVKIFYYLILFFFQDY